MLRILLIEDNPADVRIIKLALGECGIMHILDVISDGESAVEYCLTHGSVVASPHPDVVLLDLGLPKISGLRVLQSFRDQPVLRQIRVITMSSAFTPGEQRQIQSLNAESFVKSLDFNHFLRLCSQLECPKGYAAVAAAAAGRPKAPTMVD